MLGRKRGRVKWGKGKVTNLFNAWPQRLLLYSRKKGVSRGRKEKQKESQRGNPAPCEKYVGKGE